jgi:hypothetical protein
MHTQPVSRRSLRLAAAGSFVIGFAMFVVGVALALSMSWSVGASVYVPGAALMGVSRFAARTFKLPAP